MLRHHTWQCAHRIACDILQVFQRHCDAITQLQLVLLALSLALTPFGRLIRPSVSGPRSCVCHCSAEKTRVGQDSCGGHDSIGTRLLEASLRVGLVAHIAIRDYRNAQRPLDSPNGTQIGGTLMVSLLAPAAMYGQARNSCLLQLFCKRHSLLNVREDAHLCCHRHTETSHESLNNGDGSFYVLHQERAVSTDASAALWASEVDVDAINIVLYEQSALQHFLWVIATQLCEQWTIVVVCGEPHLLRARCSRVLMLAKVPVFWAREELTHR
mmetsp:Transcript_31485/g.82261  ORF Transcript_31485/g.82261 Transcript_31485/m.82261 type:complete len:270 (-) Transcript_31485:99-908(-)